MPAGITHMTLSRVALNELHGFSGFDAKHLLNDLIGAYLMGSLGPDLPYMGNFDNNPWSGNDAVADDLHYKKTNQVPLKGLELAKKAMENGDVELAQTRFAFFLGYASHLIADGIIHPYIRDTVGDYEVAKTEHRTLEMKLDVLVAAKYLGVENNGVSIQEDLDFIVDHERIDEVFEDYRELINSIHGHDLPAGKITELAQGMQRALAFAEGKFPEWYGSFLGEGGAAYMDYADIKKQEEKITNLGLPIDAEKKGLTTNFAGRTSINFFKDVLPRYYGIFPDVITAAYDYVFNNGPEITSLLPEINFDTGRLLTNLDLKNTPQLWIIA